jgi:hypothetical protein
MAEPVEVASTPIDRAKLLSLAYLSRGRTRNAVVDGYRPNGERCKSTTDELGNTVTESAERQDVLIKAPHVRAVIAQTEVRD